MGGSYGPETDQRAGAGTDPPHGLLRIAQALGLTIPHHVLLQATEVIQ
jgi:hypothetical protein